MNNINTKRRRRRIQNAPGWWLHNHVINHGIAIGATAGIQYLKSKGAPDITMLANAIGGGIYLYKVKDDIGRQRDNYELLKSAVGIFTAGAAIPETIKSLYREKIHKAGKRPKMPKGWYKNARRHALAASHSYFPHNERKHFGNWKYLRALSDDRLQIHEQKHTGTWQIGVRGTKGIRDFYTDLFVLTGAIKKEFKSTKDKIKKLQLLHKTLHPNGKFEMSGHSLGGSMIQHFMADDEISAGTHEAHIFNPGASFLSPSEKYPEHLHIHVNRGDGVSFYLREEEGGTYHYHHGDSNNPIKEHWNDNWENPEYWQNYDYGNESSFFDEK